MLNKAILCDVFFDLDHTLWDFEKNSSLTFERVFEEMKIKTDFENFLRLNAIKDPIKVINRAKEYCDAPKAIPIHIARSKIDRL